MSLKAIAVNGCTLEFQNGGSGTITITSGQTSTKVKCDGKAAYKTLAFTISGYSADPSTRPTWVPQSGSGDGSIQASSQHVKIEGNAALLEGDQSATITINGQEQSGSSTIPAVAVEIVKITDAGQTKVKGA